MTGTGEDHGGGGRLLTLIGAAWRRIRRFFSGGEGAACDPVQPDAVVRKPVCIVRDLSGSGDREARGGDTDQVPPGGAGRAIAPGYDGQELPDHGEGIVGIPLGGDRVSSGGAGGDIAPEAPAPADLHNPYPAWLPEPDEPDDNPCTSFPGDVSEYADPAASGASAPAPTAPWQQGVSDPGDPGPASEEREEDPAIDLSRWTVTLHTESPFAKVGRLYLAGNDLVIRSDLDRRGFSIALADVVHVLEGETGPVRLIGSGSVIGSARTSSSGKAMNFSIPPFFYTTPLRSLCPVLDEQARKAPLFVGREAVEG